MKKVVFVVLACAIVASLAMGARVAMDWPDAHLEDLDAECETFRLELWDSSERFRYSQSEFTRDACVHRIVTDWLRDRRLAGIQRTRREGTLSQLSAERDRLDPNTSRPGREDPPAIVACGNGVVENEPGRHTEECDDGNLVDGDGCSSTCTNEQP